MAHTFPRPGEVLDVRIDGLGLQGQGVGRWGDLIVFVPGALPGDRVRARVEGKADRDGSTTPGDGRRYVTAEIVSVEEPSPDRVQPPCALAASCGGCQLLHLSYPAQLQWKTTFIREALRRIGKLGEVPVRPCLGAREPAGYRNKAQFPVVAAYRSRRALRGSRGSPGTRGRGVRGRASGPLKAGLYRRGSHEVVPVEDCLLQRPVNNRILSAAVRLATELGVTAYDEDTGEGDLRHLLARVSSDGRTAMAVFVTSRPTFPMGRRLAAALREAVPEVKTVVQNVNTRRTNVILGPRNIVLAGPGHITDRLGGLAFRVSATSFFQVNPEQAEVLYDVAARMAAGARRSADIYCGVGTITLYLASRIGTLEEITGVESNPDAVRDAAANARANAATAGVEKAGFVCGDAATVLRDMASSGVPLDTVILDPPRKGCAPEVLKALIDMACERIIYISCNPATLARDLGHLAAGGYRVEEVQPVDMFPHTSHVESCTLLTRGAEGGRGREGQGVAAVPGKDVTRKHERRGTPRRVGGTRLERAGRRGRRRG